MRSTLLTLFGLLLLAAAPLKAQEMSLQGRNEARWADGIERLGNQDRAQRYFENRLNLDLYYGNVRLGTRITLLQPSEFGEVQTGAETIERRFLEYFDPEMNLRLRAGNLYTVWGRGLSLALIEDIVQGFDSGLDGLLVAAGTGDLEFEAIAGRSQAGFLGQVRPAQLSGGHLRYHTPLGVTLGGNGVLVTPTDDPSTYQENRTWGGFAEGHFGSLSLFAEQAVELVSGIDETFGASYGSASYSAGSFGLLLDYKRYNYHRFGGAAGGGTAYAQSVDILPFHSAPVVQREFTSPLLGRHPHIVRFDDEVGFQAELSWMATRGTTLILNYAQSSSFERAANVIPSLAEQDSPFRELYAEVNSYVTPDWYVIGWLGAHEDVVFQYDEVNPALASWFRRVAVGTKQELQLGSTWSALASAELLLSENIVNEETFSDQLLTLGVGYGTSASLAVTWERTGEELSPGERTDWIKAEGRLFLSGSHELLFTVGQERGGLVCTSGKCRLVTPFEGAKLTWTTLF